MEKIKTRQFFTPQKILFILIAAFLAFSFFSTIVYAADPPPATYEERLEKMPNPIAKTCYKWGDFIYGDDMLESVQDSLFLSGTRYETMWNMAKSVYNLIKIVGIGFAIMYYILGLIDKVSMDNFNLEHFFKATMKFALGVIIINNGTTLLQHCMEFGDGIFVMIINNKDGYFTVAGGGEEGAGGLNPLDQLYYQLIATEKYFLNGSVQALGILVDMIIPYICMFLAKIIIMVNAYSRVIEFFVRAAFAPIGISDMFSGNGNSSGLRYLKKLLAVGIQGALILVIVLAYSALLYIVSSNSLGALEKMGAQVQYIIVTFAIIGLMAKSMTWANDILGV